MTELLLFDYSCGFVILLYNNSIKQRIYNKSNSCTTSPQRYGFIPNYNRNILLTIIVDVSTAAAAFFGTIAPD